MAEDKKYSLDEAHRHFAVEFNNAIFKILEEQPISQENKEKAIGSAYAALLHWREHDKYQIVNEQRGNYMLAKAYVFSGDQNMGLAYAHKTLKITEDNWEDVKDFDRAYAYEILARAYALNDEKEAFDACYAKARELGSEIEKKGDLDYWQMDFEDGPWFDFVKPK